MIFLKELNEAVDATRGLHHVSEIASSLPGWISWQGQDYKMLYLHRFDHCGHCKTRVRYHDRHTFQHKGLKWLDETAAGRGLQV